MKFPNALMFLTASAASTWATPMSSAKAAQYKRAPNSDVERRAAGSYQNFLLQQPTQIDQTSDSSQYEFITATWTDFQTRPIAIKKKGTTHQKTEVHVLSHDGASFGIQTETALPETDDSWQLMMADYDGDKVLDLVAIKKQDTDSGYTEVHILSGRSNFQDFILQTKTSIPVTDELTRFAIGDWDKDGIPDLFVIKRGVTGDPATHLTILSGKSGFRYATLDGRTGLDNAHDYFDYALGDYDLDGTLDLFAIKKQATETQSTEVHVLSGSSKFANFILQTGTVLAESGDDFQFGVGTWASGKPDLYVFKTGNTDSHKIELQILKG